MAVDAAVIRRYARSEESPKLNSEHSTPFGRRHRSGQRRRRRCGLRRHLRAPAGAGRGRRSVDDRGRQGALHDRPLGRRSLRRRPRRQADGAAAASARSLRRHPGRRRSRDQEEGLKAPLIIRFQDMLHHRVRVLNEAFNRAITENKFRGTYRGVFPIKVNQLREVVEEISKPVAPTTTASRSGPSRDLRRPRGPHDPESLIICNGYKDDAFIRTALLGRKLGKKVHPHRREALRGPRHHPHLQGDERRAGDRRGVRLVARGAGKWAESGGEHAKFGLSTAEILEREPPRAGRPEERLQAGALPHRLAGPRHPHRQARGARGGALLREAPSPGHPII